MNTNIVWRAAVAVALLSFGAVGSGCQGAAATGDEGQPVVLEAAEWTGDEKADATAPRLEATLTASKPKVEFTFRIGQEGRQTAAWADLVVEEHAGTDAYYLASLLDRADPTQELKMPVYFGVLTVRCFDAAGNRAQMSPLPGVDDLAKHAQNWPTLDPGSVFLTDAGAVSYPSFKTEPETAMGELHCQGAFTLGFPKPEEDSRISGFGSITVSIGARATLTTPAQQ